MPDAAKNSTAINFNLFERLPLRIFNTLGRKVVPILGLYVKQKLNLTKSWQIMAHIFDQTLLRKECPQTLPDIRNGIADCIIEVHPDFLAFGGIFCHQVFDSNNVAVSKVF